MIGVQIVKSSYHEEHADYLKNVDFLHDSPIYFHFRFTSILKIHFFKNISHIGIFWNTHWIYSILFWKKTNWGSPYW